MAAMRSDSLERRLGDAGDRCWSRGEGRRNRDERNLVDRAQCQIRDPPRSRSSGRYSTAMSATGSPDDVRGFRSSMAAPMARKASRSPVRVGLTPTLRTTIELPGVIAAAVMKNAAAEKSPATSTSPPFSGAAAEPHGVARSTRSLRRDSGAGVRCGRASRGRRRPGPRRRQRARRRATPIFTCADGESRMKWRVSIAGRPHELSGRRPCVVSILAPKARSCAATGSIGRRRSESSPSNRARTPAPAQTPSSMRTVEPEFMQSRVRRRRAQRRAELTTTSSPRCESRAERR